MYALKTQIYAVVSGNEQKRHTINISKQMTLKTNALIKLNLSQINLLRSVKHMSKNN